MQIEVVFASPDRQELLVVDVPEGATIAQVIEESGLTRRFQEVDLDALQAGVWGKPVLRDIEVKDGDRVELYRELAMDPRDARRSKVGV